MAGWDFLQLEESIRGTDPRAAGLFQNEGEVRVGRRRSKNPNYQRQLLEAMRLIERASKGERRATYLLEEAMSTSDFQYLFGDILDREVLARYTEWPSQWKNIVQTRTVNDFRDVKVYKPITGTAATLTVVDELEEYPEASIGEQAPFTYRVKKYGRRFAVSWETFINQDEQLNNFNELPDLLALSARRTEDREAVALYVDASGPHASFFTNGNKNIVNTTNGAATNNPALSISGLQDAFTVLANQVDEDGEPIMIDMVTLVVPPALEITARNILNATELQIGLVGQGADAAPVTETRLQVANWMRNRVQLAVVPYITQTASTANGKTSWFLFASPTAGARPALRMAFLRGHETPEIWMKRPNAVRVGGGDVGPDEGDFETDSRQWRVRHVLGTVRIDPKMAVASNGSGS